MAIDFSARTITPADSVKILGHDTNGGYMEGSALKNYILSGKGNPNGLAELDENGKLPEEQLPTLANDVLEYDSYSVFPAVGETGKIYVDKAQNTLYRWTGSSYVSVSADTSELEQRVGDLEAQVEDLETEVTSQQKVIADNKKDIAYLKFANDGKTMIWEESDRDGYSVDVKPATVTGTAFGEAVLKSMEGRDVSARDGVVYPITGERVIEIAYKNPRGTQGIRTWGSTSSITFGDSEIPTTDLAKVRVGDIALIAIKNSDTGDTDYIVRGITSASASIIESGGGHGLGSIIGGAFSPNSPYGDNYGWVVMYAGTILNNNVTEVRSEGRNLFDKTSASIVESRKVDYTNGSYTLWGSTWGVVDKYPIEGGVTYTLSMFENISSGNNGIAFYDADGAYISGVVASSSSNHAQTVTTPANARFMSFSVSSGYSVDVVQLEKGSVATAYTPYRPPVTLSLPSICSTLHGVGSARDKVSFVNDADGKRWLERKVDTITFDGSSDEIWYKYGADRDVYHIDVPNLMSSTDEFVCGKFTPKKYAWTNSSEYANCMGSNGGSYITVFFNMIGNGVTTISAWRAWLAQHPVTVVYRLATPQLLDITDLVPEEPSLPIEDGGTLTFVNENKVATPSRISMPVKLGGTV